MRVVSALAVMVIVLVGAVWAQVVPPAKPSAAIPFPSGLPVSAPTAAPAQAPLTPGQMPAHHAVVRYQDGRLLVEANNSSLNQILWAIGHEMGMKITGGVADERVYGTYGPADPGQILSALLDGTGSNMLLKDGSAPGASELVLTPRGGGATPPPPAPGPDVAEQPREDLPPQQMRPPMRSMAVPAPPSPAPAPAATPAATPPTVAPAASTGLPQSPNGVLTPDQVVQQLMKLRQQQNKTPPQ